MRIRNHLDAQSGPAYGRKLSQRRADAVREYLIDKGVEAERLISVGYEDSRPIATNRTPEGRAQNRRTEFLRTDMPGCDAP